MKKQWLVGALLFPLLLMGQMEVDSTASDYYIKMSKTVNLRFDLDNDVRTFLFEGEQDSYSIEPNTNLRMNIAFNYRFLSLRIGFSPKFLASADSESKGSTKVFRIGLNFFIKDVWQTLEYNHVKGYYVNDFEDPDGLFNQAMGDYILLPDLNTLWITGTTSYPLNSNYSFKAVTNQNEVQTVSAGSFVPSLQYGYFEITDDTTPQDMKALFGIANIGYFHTFVFNKYWFSNLGIAPGLGMEYINLITRIDDDSVNTYHTSLLFNIQTQISLGFNSRRLYGGGVLNGSATNRDNKSIIQFNNVRGYFRLYVGYRFDDPDSFERAFDWIESKNPFKKKDKN